MTEKTRQAEEGFKGIVGQDVPSMVLAHLVGSERLPGTMLFSGPGGAGKLACALALAKVLHCRDGSDRGCECDSCRAIRNGIQPDVIVLSRDRNILVDEMREIVALAGLRSAPGQERVIIIDNAEKITQAAQNAALKAFEEPGEHVRFILIADNPAPLLPTVRSRAYGVRFTLVAHDAMEEFARTIGDDPSDADTAEAIRFAMGRPGNYLRWKRSEGYRGVVDEVAANIRGILDTHGVPTLEGALDWKSEFWQLADKLTSAERSANLPRGGDAFEIGRFIESPKEFPVSPINWRVEESPSRETRWGQGRKALLLAGLARRIVSLDLDAGAIGAIAWIQDFMEKVRFNCSFDIALERLYFGLARA